MEGNSFMKYSYLYNLAYEMTLYFQFLGIDYIFTIYILQFHRAPTLLLRHRSRYQLRRLA